MSEPRTTAVIVTYKSRRIVPHTLEAARRAHEAGLLECVVVDNASGDGTAEFVEKEHPWVTVVASGANLGFGRGCNLGFKHVTTPYVLLINPDAVLEADGLAHLVQFADEHPRAGIMGPAIVDPDGSFEPARKLPTPWSIISSAARLPGRQPRLRPIAPGEQPRRVEWLCGAALLIRRTMLEELGGFDPRFFLYFEETDLCFRAQRAGFEIWAVGTATARHVGGATASGTGAALYHGSIADHYFRSRYYYLVKHHGWMAASAAEVVEWLLMSGRALGRMLLKRDKNDLITRLRAPILQMPARAG